MVVTGAAFQRPHPAARRSCAAGLVLLALSAIVGFVSRPLAFTGLSPVTSGALVASEDVMEGSRVAMNARSPFPTTPMGDRGRRRQGAGGRPFTNRGNIRRQVAVRVNRKTNKPIRYPMHVRAGDTVQVMKGKDKGKVTQVIKIYPKWNKVLCLGVNFCIKHVRPSRDDEVGQRVQVEAPFDASNVMHYDEKEQTVGLLGIKFEKDGDEIKKVRYNKATGNPLPYIEEKPRWVPVLDRN